MKQRIGYSVLIIGLTTGLLARGASTSADGWPSFRGPLGNGVVPAADPAHPGQLPLEWSESSHVRWKTEIPHIGWSTPVVLDGQVWITTATKDGHDFYALCLNADTGEIQFNQHLIRCDDPEPLGNNVNGYASPTAAIESGRVYIHFGSYGTFCLDTQTAKVLWKRQDLPCRHYRGPGSSVILFENLLILTMDGVDVQYVCALDKQTGKTVWKTDRTTAWTDLDEQGQPKREGDFRKAFSTPLIIRSDDRAQLISPASSALYAYDPRDGRELWNIQHEGYSTSITPVYANGLVFTATGRGLMELRGIRPDGQGDVAGTHVAWHWLDRNVPATPSPVTVGEWVYTVSDRGTVTCLDATSGRTVWSERIGGSHIASPIVQGNRIYFSSVQGKTTVIQAGRSFKQLAENQLDTGFMASPAVAGNALFLRSKTHLYRIEEAAGSIQPRTR